MLNNSIIENLYQKYLTELTTIRNKMVEDHKNGQPQFDDIEAELTILLILELKPKNIIEFSPCTGWSTSIILNTLELNNNNATLSSYDILDNCFKFIKNKKYENVKWNF